MDGAFTTRPVDPELADAYFAKVRSYEGDQLTSMRRQRNGALVFAVVGFATAAVMSIAVDVLVKRPPSPPMVFVADRSTGLVEHMTDLAGETIGEVAAFNRNFASSYVQSREGYVWEAIAAQNAAVAAYSSQDEYARYLAQQRAPGGAAQVYGRRAMIRTLVRSVHLMSDPKEEAKRGVITVFYDRAEIKAGDDVSPFWDEKTGCLRQTETCHRWSATVDFERLGTKLPESLRTKNPLGWLVTAYEARQEGS